ncbi:MAG: hypothetical protein FJX72_01090 [Armatimonadetes bacterium]|nr:hypothetical protein [Armatimonadota bacterium]
MNPLTLSIAALIGASVVAVGPARADEPTFAYTALSDAARKAGQLDRYRNVPLSSGSLALGDCRLTYSLPRSARAYDVVPIRYTLERPAAKRRAAVEAVAFEDAARTGGKPLYDLAIPGNMRVKIEYLGSVSADFDDERYIPLTADPKTPISPFPPYRRDAMVRSGTVRAAEAVWFKFRITNTGDTVLDPDGFGASLAQPLLYAVDESGKERYVAGTINGFERNPNYMYPGESVEHWINFYNAPGGWVRGMKPGDYKIHFRMLFRYYKEFNWGINIWHGAEFARLEVPIRVRDEAADTPVEERFVATDHGETMPGFLSAFEEFMTTFRIHRPGDRPTREEGVVYLQVAPWTKDVVLKLILTDPREMAVARVPIVITEETLKITHNPKNVMVVEKDGKEEPAIVVMALPGMRSGFQLGPYPEVHMDEELRELRDIGANVISNTAGGWWIGEVGGRKDVELHSACYKYWYDVLMRKHGMKTLGWAVYPPTGPDWYTYAEPLLGRKVEPSMAEVGYGGHRSVDMGDASVPEVIAAWAKYNYERWGDTWYRTRDGRVPIEMEDTWGWMRDDINVRYPVGPKALQRFREWVAAKYGSIEAANKAWNSKYADFAAIDPQADQGNEDFGDLKHAPVYNKPDHVFHDWTPATEDWDRFRTHLRMDILRKANAIIRKTIPGAELSVRTEGSNILTPGDPKSENMHRRHIHYSQRRNAMVYDVLRQEDVLHFYNDYTTLPHSEYDWREAMREMVAWGGIPMFLPMFNHMRDIVLNPHHGRDYRVHYGLDTPTNGAMVHCLVAAFPWWKATYEEGGAPGIIWADFGCDAFGTETQKREMKLLSDQFKKMAR